MAIAIYVQTLVWVLVLCVLEWRNTARHQDYLTRNPPPTKYVGGKSDFYVSVPGSENAK